MLRPFVRTIILTVCLLAAAGPLAAEVISLPAAATTARLEMAPDGTEVLKVTVSEVRLDAVTVDDRSWAVVRVPSGHNLMVRGEPSLPFVTAEYLLEATGGIDLKLIDVTTRDIDLTARGFAGVAPSRGHFNRNVDPATVPWVFSPKVYGQPALYPAEAVWMDQPFIAGPLRGQSARLPVARWSSVDNVLTVVEEARYRVVHTSVAANPRLRPQPPMTGLYDQLARQRMVNYDLARGRYTPFVETGRLLILAYDDFVDEAAPLAAWQQQVGYPTLLVPLSDAGSTAAQIASYIQTLYDQPEGLSWIILVGDAQQVPFLYGVYETAPCDPCYTKLEGNDNRPDAAISRISAQTGAEVTVQVDKILTYERYPDEGSAAVWYSKAFGIGGDDDLVPPPDWQRIDMLRADLVEPAYTYTEFDELYHNPSKAQVAGAVNDGRSLGLYIGHGAETSWVTSSFSVSDVNSMLTNGDMLPVIWDVACVNGKFNRSGGDCFAEAWLKKDGGGAVSFEAATTNESWVPPCDAQRGVIDSLRLETAFTTGGEHVNGKLYCMDVNFDGDDDEGTKFMEQSTLFGACTTWMRTLPPSIPDEPMDFGSAGGVATLTVTVGGQPLAKANAAIVSFYTRDGSDLTPLGSGLIDDTGVVHASVSGDPTHCHIHGQNLVPVEYELAARPDGTVSLDAASYGCGSTVTIRVTDSNVPGATPTTLDTVQVTLALPGDSTTVVLTETAVDRSMFVGSAVLGTDLSGGDGDQLTVTYVDADDGAGGVNVVKTDTAVLDCAGPVVSGLTVSEIGGTSAVVLWTTDEPADSWAGASPGDVEASEAGYRTEHRIELDGLEQCTYYTVEVASTDALGNLGTGGPTAPFQTLQLSVAVDDDVESGPGGWTVDTAIGGGINWMIASDQSHSPTHAWFSSDAGAVKDDRLVAGPYALGGGSTTLAFWHHYDFESNWDGGVLEVSTNGTTWQDVATVGTFIEGEYNGTLNSYGSNPLAGRSAWSGASAGFVQTVVDLSGLAGSEVWLRFRVGCDGSVAAPGWWVDDIVLETSAACTGMPFADGFESGDCTAWSSQVP